MRTVSLRLFRIAPPAGQFNEALMTMFRGFHPDAYWEIPDQGLGDSNGSYFAVIRDYARR
jgi:hypothetical protein